MDLKETLLHGLFAAGEKAAKATRHLDPESKQVYTVLKDMEEALFWQRQECIEKWPKNLDIDIQGRRFTSIRRVDGTQLGHLIAPSPKREGYNQPLRMVVPETIQDDQIALFIYPQTFTPRSSQLANQIEHSPEYSPLLEEYERWKQKEVQEHKGSPYGETLRSERSTLFPMRPGSRLHAMLLENYPDVLKPMLWQEKLGVQLNWYFQKKNTAWTYPGLDMSGLYVEKFSDPSTFRQITIYYTPHPLDRQFDEIFFKIQKEFLTHFGRMYILQEGQGERKKDSQSISTMHPIFKGR